MKDKPVTEQSKRDLVFSLYYYICLVALGGVVVWHWILGGDTEFSERLRSTLSALLSSSDS